MMALTVLYGLKPYNWWFLVTTEKWGIRHGVRDSPIMIGGVTTDDRNWMNAMERNDLFSD